MRTSLQQDSIRIRGARVHNLKNVSLEIPHEKLTVVTGVSGSGKSSLAFDTIYAEGQRRYVESLSAYARQFLERMEKPDVDEIDGIAPPVAIRQKNTTRNPRSTVATSTELYDFLRLLWARAGRTYCPNCGIHVERDTVDQVAGENAGAAGRVALVRAVSRCRQETHHRRVARPPVRPAQEGLQPAVSGRRACSNFRRPNRLLDIDFSKPVFALVDRIAISPGMRQRLVDTVEICYREAGEVDFRAGASGGERLRFNEKFACKRCGKEFVEPEPSLFSFNNPYGACKRCQGFGNTIDYDMDLVIPEPLPVVAGRRGRSLDQAAAFLVSGRFPPSRQRQGPPQRAVLRADAKTSARSSTSTSAATFSEVETKKYKVHVRVFLSRYRGYTLCPDCGGSRLRPEALYIRVGGKNLADVVAHEHRRGAGVFQRAASCRRKRPPSPKRCWSRSGSG